MRGGRSMRDDARRYRYLRDLAMTEDRPTPLVFDADSKGNVYPASQPLSGDRLDREVDAYIKTAPSAKAHAATADARERGGASARPSLKVDPHAAGRYADDPLYDRAATLVLSNKRVSISLLQRHLVIGYNRAARLIEEMERRGVVSPMDASGMRCIVNNKTSGRSPS
jgi:DNA segregation ATPase FtsK/SpoIIIE-like protein